MSSKPEPVVNCFDLDGTLYKLKGGSFTESPLSSDLKKLIQEFLNKELPDSEMDEREFRYILSKIYKGETSLAVEDLLEIPRDEYFERTWGRLNPRKYVEKSFSYQDLFAELDSEINVLVTSAPRVWAEKILSILAIERYFSAIRTGEPEPRKPSPKTFERTIETALGPKKPGEIYFIGDQPCDFPDSVKWEANVYKLYVGQSNPPEKTDYQLSTVMELPEVKVS